MARNRLLPLRSGSFAMLNGNNHATPHSCIRPRCSPPLRRRSPPPISHTLGVCWSHGLSAASLPAVSLHLHGQKFSVSQLFLCLPGVRNLRSFPPRVRLPALRSPDRAPQDQAIFFTCEPCECWLRYCNTTQPRHVIRTHQDTQQGLRCQS